MAITSQIRSASIPFDMGIDDWQIAGLLKPSAVKPIFATLEQTLILARLGALAPQDQSALRDAIAALLG